MKDINTTNQDNKLNPNNILTEMDGRALILNSWAKKIVYCRANFENLSVDMFDSMGNFIGCFITDQLPSLVNNSFSKRVEILPYFTT